MVSKLIDKLLISTIIPITVSSCFAIGKLAFELEPERYLLKENFNSEKQLLEKWFDYNENGIVDKYVVENKRLGTKIVKLDLNENKSFEIEIQYKQFVFSGPYVLIQTSKDGNDDGKIDVIIRPELSNKDGYFIIEDIKKHNY